MKHIFRNLVLGACSLWGSSILYGQLIEQNNSYREPKDQTCYSVQWEIDQGRYAVMAGETVEPGGGSTDAVILPLESCFAPGPAGNFGFPGSNEVFFRVRSYEIPNLAGNNQGYVAVGWSDQYFPEPDGYIVVAQRDPQNPGSLIVYKDWILDFMQEDDQFTGVEPTSDGGFIVTGYVTSPGTNGLQKDPVAVKIVPNGSTLVIDWRTKLDFPDGDDVWWSVIENSAGNYVFAGYTTDPNCGPCQNVLVSELTSSGAVIDNYRVDVPFSAQQAMDIGEFPPGSSVDGYYLSGFFSRGSRIDAMYMNLDLATLRVNAFETYDHSPAPSNPFSEIAFSIEYHHQTSPNNFEWVTLVGDAGENPNKGFALNIMPDGNFHPNQAWTFHADPTSSEIFYETDLYAFPSSPLGYLLMGGKTNHSGSAKDDFYLATLELGGKTCESVLETFGKKSKNGSIVTLPGWSFINMDLHGSSLVYDTEYDEINRCPNGGTTCKKGSTSGSTSAELEEQIEAVTIYPVPASTELRVAATTEIMQIRLFDLSGRLLSSHQTVSLEAKINVSGMASGVYFAEILLTSGEVRRIKWMKQ